MFTLDCCLSRPFRVEDNEVKYTWLGLGKEKGTGLVIAQVDLGQKDESRLSSLVEKEIH